MSRRSVLLGGLGLGAGLVAGCQQQAGPAGTPDALQTRAPVSEAPPVVTGRSLSAGRYREVDIVIIRPAGIPPEPIPVCLALHGGLGTAKGFLELGLPDMLTQLVKSGNQPFAIASVDGGRWVGDKDDDPQRMLNQDLPGWLDYHDLASTPFSVLGFGEGGSAALVAARTPGYAAVAAISPTLFDTWGEAAGTKIYHDEAQWKEFDPLRHTVELSNVPVGLWCGTEDRPFVDLTRRLADKTKAVTASFTPGGHDTEYFKRALPEALKFVGGYL
ncbi:esterase [Actinokineospora sp. NBRC 105648]|nr:esterase [Actinokineospora sp. NBRC 105648]